MSINCDNNNDDNLVFTVIGNDLNERTKDMKIANPVKSIALDKLISFPNHPFKLYEGQRLKDMVESIRTNGVLVPIIVRPTNGNKFEILAGHNRVSAAKEAGLKTIPAAVHKDLPDEDAELIVTETNFVQRSIQDMRHSELAAAITMLYNALKKKSGYRSDLVEALQELEGEPTCSQVGNTSEDTDSQSGNRSNTMTKVGKQYGLSKNTIHRYLQINKLSEALKARLDSGEIARGAAVDLSYMRGEEQEIVNDLLEENGRVSLEQARTLKDESKKRELSQADIIQILELGSSSVKKRSVKIKEALLSQYFKEDQSSEEMEEVMEKALELYFSSLGKD